VGILNSTLAELLKNGMERFNRKVEGLIIEDSGWNTKIDQHRQALD